MNKVYTKKTNSKGVVQYRNVTENKPVSKDKLSPELLARLDVAPEGTHVPESAELSPNAGEQYDEASAAPGEDMVDMPEIDQNILINGVVYESGKQQRVPRAVAEDLKRINRDYQQYEKNLVKKQDFSRTSDVRPQDVQTPPSQAML